MMTQELMRPYRPYRLAMTREYQQELLIRDLLRVQSRVRVLELMRERGRKLSSIWERELMQLRKLIWEMIRELLNSEAQALCGALQAIINFLVILQRAIQEVLRKLRSISDRLRELITQAFNFCGQRIKSTKCHAFLKSISFPRSASIFSLTGLTHAFLKLQFIAG